jgi:hypothetical protein
MTFGKPASCRAIAQAHLSASSLRKRPVDVGIRLAYFICGEPKSQAPADTASVFIRI